MHLLLTRALVTTLEVSLLEVTAVVRGVALRDQQQCRSVLVCFVHLGQPGMAGVTL
jgi:hypothetical protein